MDGRPTWTDCDEAGDYVVPNVLSPRDLVFRPDNMAKTVLYHTQLGKQPLDCVNQCYIFLLKKLIVWLISKVKWDCNPNDRYVL